MVTARHHPESVLSGSGYALAGVYAEALLAAAPANAVAEDVAVELESLARLLDEWPEAARLLTVATIGKKQRCELVERVFAGRTSEPLAGLLAVLARNGRLELVGAIARRFRKLLHRRQGRVEVTVTTAFELDEPTRQAVAEMIEQMIRAEPLLTTRVDPDLLGGATVRVGDRVYDASIATSLSRLSRSMLAERSIARPDQEKRSDHE